MMMEVLHRYFSDVNECEEGLHSCVAGEEDCVNTVGSYRCKALPLCPSGFRRNPSDNRCAGVLFFVRTRFKMQF